MFSAGLTSHFSIKSQKNNRICHTIFYLTTCWSFVDAGPLWLLTYKQQSLAYSKMFYLLWSHAEYRTVLFIYCYYNVGTTVMA